MKLLSNSQYADTVGIRKQSARLQRMRGTGPPFIRLSDSPTGRVFYRLEDVEKWLAGRPSYRSTAEEKAALRAVEKAATRGQAGASGKKTSRSTRLPDEAFGGEAEERRQKS